MHSKSGVKNHVGEIKCLGILRNGDGLMKLKKKSSLFAVLLISAIVVFFLLGNYIYYEIGGDIVVNDPNFEIKEYADCKYGIDGLLDEKVICKRIKDGIIFKSHSSKYSLYKYKFYIEGNGISICPEITLSHDALRHDRYSFVIELSPNDGGGYSAVVRGRKGEKGCAYYKCYDVEKEGISFQIGP